MRGVKMACAGWIDSWRAVPFCWIAKKMACAGWIDSWRAVPFCWIANVILMETIRYVKRLGGPVIYLASIGAKLGNISESHGQWSC
jgi:hypothetical protein